MRKLILLFGLIAFIGLSSFDRDNKDVESTEIVKSEVIKKDCGPWTDAGGGRQQRICYEIIGEDDVPSIEYRWKPGGLPLLQLTAFDYTSSTESIAYESSHPIAIISE